MKNRSWPIVPILALSLSIARADETALDRADELARQREYQKALSILRQYDKSHPDDVEAHDRIQRILKRQNTQQGARAEYKYRFERDPTPFNRYLYARMLDSPVERDAKFREMISEHPKVVWGYLGLANANALMDQDRLQDGIDAANDGARNVTEPAELYLVQAMIYRLMQDYPNAAAAGREYGRLKPNEHTRSLASSFEWMEVDHRREPGFGGSHKSDFARSPRRGLPTPANVVIATSGQKVRCSLSKLGPRRGWAAPSGRRSADARRQRRRLGNHPELHEEPRLLLPRSSS